MDIGAIITGGHLIVLANICSGHDTSDMNITAVLDALRLDHDFVDNVSAWERLPARPARFSDTPPALDERLVRLLQKVGKVPLFSHQVQAIELALGGQHVVIATGTASGKSLAYHLTTLQLLLQTPDATALYLFPTKALAQDQLAALGELEAAIESAEPVPALIYDGDTPQGQRARIRREGRIILSNPDMLHVAMLPYHTQWAAFFSNLQLVVLDELHIYRGIFGSHMANVLRRLRRICRFYGSNPTFICTSATIANPSELAEHMLEAPVALVNEDGSPSGEKHIILYNPPLVNKRMGVRRSYTLESASLSGRLLAGGVQAIIFARSRLTTEVLLGYVRDMLKSMGRENVVVRGYRGGYLPTERRDIESGLRRGEVQAVVATNALELGIDIGTLGAAVLAGYPGTIASTWQQLGRAGRRSESSVGIIVASAAALDQYLANHPRYLFEHSPEQALIDPDNLAILVNHLRCAVFELPFQRGEGFGRIENVEQILSVLAEEGEIHTSETGFRWIAGAYPAAALSLRTSGLNPIIIQDISGDRPIVIGELDRESAPFLVYEGAVYIHEGASYLIEALDWQNGIASARPAEVDYYTSASTNTSIDVREEQDSQLVGDCVKAHGRVLVTAQTSNYKIVKRYTHETLGYGQIALPSQEFETTAYWLSLTPDLTTQLEDAQVLLRPNDYGPNWQEQRNKVRERDHFRCTRCQAPEQPGRQHDVHHLRPFRDFGYIPGVNQAYLEANQIDNLTTLCQSCHRAVESAHGARSALSGLGSVMRNVAALVLMCSPGDIGVSAEHRSTHTQTPTLTIFDQAPGGLGFSLRLYEMHTELVRRALELVRDCPCEEGCPACVGPVGEVSADTKELTVTLLEAINRGWDDLAD